MGFIMVNKKDKVFTPCWKYHKCSKESMKKCPAFNSGHHVEGFSDCWFFIEDAMVGGPGKHGPCAFCEWNKKYGLCLKKGGL